MPPFLLPLDLFCLDQRVPSSPCNDLWPLLGTRGGLCLAQGALVGGGQIPEPQRHSVCPTLHPQQPSQAPAYLGTPPCWTLAFHPGSCT